VKTSSRLPTSKRHLPKAGRECANVTTQSGGFERSKREDLCDSCQRSLGSAARLIAGESDNTKHFCSFACYDVWKQSEESGEPTLDR
jgi:hypothetical protein